MKLVLCRKCWDVFKLTIKIRQCKCGASSGRYLKDQVHAEISGESIPIGFDNISLKYSITDPKLKSPKQTKGIRFDAFVIPDNCETVKRI